MATTALSDVLVSPRNAPERAVKVNGSGLAVSWERNKAGSLAFRIPAADLAAAGLTGDLTGRWLAYEHPTAGRWGGVLTSCLVTDGVAEIAGMSFHVLAHGRMVVAPGAKPLALSKTPGALLIEAFGRVAQLDARSPMPLRLDRSAVETTGAALAVEWGPEDLYEDIVPSLTDDIDYEWDVDADRNVTFGRRLGRDLSSSVTLTEGVEVLAGSRWNDDAYTVANWVAAVGSAAVTSRKGGKSATSRYQVGPVVVQDQGSIDRYGLSRTTLDYGPVTDKSALTARAQADLATLAWPQASVELSVADVNGTWSAVRVGDLVTVVLGASGLRGVLRVWSRALDVDGSRLTLAGVGRRQA